MTPDIPKPSPNTQRSSSQVLELCNALLQVEVVSPSHPEGSQEAVRFDQTARVKSIRFKAKQMLDERGLPDEFGSMGIGVLGYEDGGDTFIKIGMALATTRIQRISEQELLFSQTCKQDNTYGYDYHKRITIDPDAAVLTFAYSLKNLGQSDLTFDTYNHNFLTLGDGPIGPRLILQPGFTPTFVPTDRVKIVDGKMTLTRKIMAPQQVYLPYFAFEKSLATTSALTDQLTGIKVTMAHEPRPLYFVFYADEHAMAPEYFIRHTVAPGQSVTWQRTYTFE
jgi:hypothetical protein